MAASSMILNRASATELVRSNHKDTLYSGYMTTLLSDILDPYIPQRYWLKWQREIQLAGELLYYGLTTVIGNQTLGEEYTNIVQVVQKPINSGGGGYVVASGLRRTLSIIFQVCGRYLLERFFHMLSVMVIERRLPFTLSPIQYNVLQWCTDNIDEAVSTVNQLHLALFYLRGMYQTIGRRLAGIQYLVVQYDKLATPTNPYKLLGLLLLLQVIYKLIKGAIDLLKGAQTDATTNSGNNTASNGRLVNVSRTLKCALCLEACRVPTATVCGHVMCWECSTEWINDKRECPMCRTALEPRQLVPLQHFEKN